MDESQVALMESPETAGLLNLLALNVDLKRQRT